MSPTTFLLHFKFPRMRARHSVLLADIARTYAYVEGNAVKRAIRCARTPGVQIVCVYRFGQWLRSQPLLVRVVLEPLYGMLNTFVRIAWGAEIPRAAKIGPGLYIGHFGGITI